MITTDRLLQSIAFRYYEMAGIAKPELAAALVHSSKLATLQASMDPRWHALLECALRSDPSGALLAKLAAAITESQ